MILENDSEAHFFLVLSKLAAFLSLSKFSLVVGKLQIIITYYTIIYYCTIIINYYVLEKLQISMGSNTNVTWCYVSFVLPNKTVIYFIK